MKKITGIALTILFSLSMFQCNKKDGNLPNPLPSREELIAGKSSKTYKITKDLLNGVDVVKNEEPCDRDDLLVFYNNHTWEVLEGAMQCYPSDSSVLESGKWRLNQRQDTIYIDSLPCYINSISKTALTITTVEEGDVEQLTLTAQ